LSEKARILGLFLGNRRYYSDRDMIFGNNLFHRSVKAASSADLIVADMQRNGITHLLIRYDLFKRWAGVQFDDAEKKILKDFFENHLVQLFSQSGYGLFQVKPRT
jgi:hypothetical protein